MGSHCSNRQCWKPPPRSSFSHRSLHWSTVNSRLGIGFLNERWPGDTRYKITCTTTFFPHKMASKNSEGSVIFVGLSVHLFNSCRVFICRIHAGKKGLQSLRKWYIELNNSLHFSLSSPKTRLIQLQSACWFKNYIRLIQPTRFNMYVLIHHWDQTISKQIHQIPWL